MCVAPPPLFSHVFVHPRFGPGGFTSSAIFVPDRLTPKQLSSIVSEVWELPLPNMLISIDAGSAHPSELATKDLCLSKEYAQWTQEAKDQEFKVQRAEASKRGEVLQPVAMAKVGKRESKRGSFSPFQRASATSMANPMNGGANVGPITIDQVSVCPLCPLCPPVCPPICPPSR